jgi:glycosyltransferase involved in cell wall biosynthesis
MTVYNGDRYVGAAIQSVLDQTMPDFEFLIVDDGSTDSTPEILAGFAARDSRIRVITQLNQGVSRSSNNALRIAKYDWIARIDADDLALPTRFERQLAFIEAHPGIAVTASFVDYINSNGEKLGAGVNPFTTPEAVERCLRAGGMIYLIHPAVMMRRDVILDVGGYRPEFALAHDIDLWNRVAERGHLVLAQPEILAQYRLHEQGMTRNSFNRLARELRWLEMCASQRRSGNLEPTFGQFEAFERRTSALRRLNHWRQDKAFVLYKEATVSRARKDLSPMMLQLGASALLQPAPALRNVWNKGVQPALQNFTSRNGAH